MAALTVLYDADCGVCTALAQLVERRARDVAVAAITSPLGDRLLRDLAPEERLGGMHVVDRLGRRRTGAAGVPAVLAALPGGAPLALLARAMPALTALGYGVFAANRRHVSRTLGLEACGVGSRSGGDGRLCHPTGS